MKVLFADDCPTTRSIIRKSLIEWGYEPIIASNGSEALNILLEPNAPRLAVLDWRMPHLEGPEICQQIRDQGSNKPYTYVIILTARGGADDFQTAITAGADEFVTKPVKEVDLKLRLANGVRLVELHDELAIAKKEIARLTLQLDKRSLASSGSR
ncbi:MAG: response regulator [Planctomycetales bacterium]|nr:response regulator [Planctomycetales bacterium]